MSVLIWLTDSDSDIAGYKRAMLGRRADSPSLVRAVTATAAGPTSGIPITRTSGGAALAWITDPLDADTLSLSAATWEVHLWAKESSLAANAALRVQVIPWTTAEGTAALDDNPGTELTATIADLARTTGVATLTPLTKGNRLVFKILIDDAGTLVTGQTVTMAYNGLHPRAEGDSYLVCPDNLRLLASLPARTEQRVRLALHQAETQGAATQPPPLVKRADVIAAMETAVEQYTRARPRTVAQPMSGDGTSYDFRLPRWWADGLSTIQEIEYPAGEQVPTTIDRDEWTIYESFLGLQPITVLRFLAATPDSGTDNIVVRHTARHVHSDQLDTIPPGDLDAVCWLAASCLALSLSADAADLNQTVLSADAANRRDAEQRWRSVAMSLQKRYDQHMGTALGPRAAGTIVDWDVRDSWGRKRLFHGGRRT